MDKINTSPSVQIGKMGVDMRGMSAGFGGLVCRGVSGVKRVGVWCGEGSRGLARGGSENGRRKMKV